MKLDGEDKNTESSDRVARLHHFRDEQPDVEGSDEGGKAIEEHSVPGLVDIFAHDALRRGEAHLQEHGEGQLDAQHHLRDEESLEGIADEEDEQQGQSQ